MSIFTTKNKRKHVNDYRPQRDENFLSIDIGTEFVKVALGRFGPDSDIEVIGYDRVPQHLNAMRGALIADLNQVVNAVDMAVGNAILAAENAYGEIPLPNSAIFGIAGEAVKGMTLVVNYEREDPDQPITQAEIDEILEQIREQAYENARNELAEEAGLDPAQMIEVNTSINAIRIDGLRVNNPLGFTGNAISYRIYVSFAPKIHIDAIQTVAERLGLHVISIVVAPYALAVGMKRANQEDFSAIFVDIGGGTTDVALIEQGNLVGTTMFAFGGRVFTKRVAKELNVDMISAEQTKIDYSDQKLAKPDADKVRGPIQNDVLLLLDGITISLNEFEDIDKYPSKIYLCGGGAMLSDIRSQMIEYPWMQTLPFNQFPKVNFLLPNQIDGVTDLTRKAVDPRDVTPLTLLRMVNNLN